MNKRNRKKFARSPVHSPNYCRDCEQIHEPGENPDCLSGKLSREAAERFRMDNRRKMRAKLDVLVPILECFDIKVKIHDTGYTNPFIEITVLPD
jgi:hypothetical protein